MAQSVEARSTVSKTGESRFRVYPRICVNASKGIETSDKNNVIKQRSTRKYLIARDELIRQGKEIYEQKRLDQCRQLEERSAPNLAYIQTLDQKQSVLEVQAILLKKLAAEENQLKGLEGVSRPSVTSFEKRVNEVEEALRALKY